MKTKKDLEKDIAYLEVERDRYKEMWEAGVKRCDESDEMLIQTAKNVKKLVDDFESLNSHNMTMIELLRVYAKWDARILQIMREQGSPTPKEGPATTYLKDIGAMDNGSNRGN
jgi:hypothetical protein